MDYSIIILLGVLLLRWAVIRGRLKEIERRIAELSSVQGVGSRDVAIQELEERVSRLENSPQLTPEVPAAPRVALITEPVRPFAVQPGRLAPEAEAAPIAVPAAESRVPQVSPPGVTPPVPPQPSMFTTWGRRMREQMAGEEWEAVIGGSWLNKLGVFTLVIGVALFLGYSLKHLGPSGRVAVGYAVSVAMLGGGVILERRPRYVIFARGLIGGGWAALYATTYATHGLEAARIIRDPLLGMLLLGAVAAGMIVHSLRYRSQVVTGLAYFIGFVTITISPVSTFAALASAPLAASLLFVAQRFTWVPMAVAGIVVTYGTYAVRYSLAPPLGSFLGDFVSGQSVLAIYWLLFEGFDLFDTARSRRDRGLAQTIFPLNACGFVGVSLLQWSSVTPTTLYIFFAASAVAYLVSTVVRTKIRPLSSFAGDTEIVTRALSGSYEAAITVAVALATPGIFLRFSGLSINVALLLEAEFLFLAGVRLGQPYLRALGAVIFTLPVIKLCLVDIARGGNVIALGLNLMAWTPVAFLTATVFYLNRGLIRPDSRSFLLLPETGYSYAASALLALILGFEMPRQYLGLGWVVLALPLFELGLRKRLEEFRWQSYGLAVLGFGTLLIVNGLNPVSPVARSSWISLGAGALLAYAGATRLFRLSLGRLPDWEQRGVRQLSSWAGTISLTALLWHVLPRDYLGLGWLVLALALLELGIRERPEELRLQAYVVAALSFCKLLLVSVFGAGGDPVRSPWISLAVGALLPYAAATRLFRLRFGRLPERERLGVRDVSSAAGTLFLTALLWHVLPTPMVAVGWGIVSLLLIELGFALPLPILRLQGNLVGALAYGRLFLANFTGTGATAGISHRMLTVFPLILLFYYLSAKLKAEGERDRLLGWERGLSRLYLYAPALLAVFLLRFEFGRVLAVVGWALLGLALLFVGIRRNNRDLRWQSYMLGILTFSRSWATNFYIPESLAGMFGRVVTGAWVIGSFYAAQLLSPRDRTEEPGAPGNRVARALDQLDLHARTMFSLLASVLLAVLLFYEVSGRLLTVAWALEGTALLVAGFPLRERPLRLSGLCLLAACVLKVFVYDLRELEALPRILSFVVLGILLLAISLIYTRFREQLRRYL